MDQLIGYRLVVFKAIRAALALHFVVVAACSTNTGKKVPESPDLPDSGDSIGFGDAVLPDAADDFDSTDAAMVGDAEALAPSRVRSCKTRFRFQTTKAVKKVELAGEWGWDSPKELATTLRSKSS